MPAATSKAIADVARIASGRSDSASRLPSLGDLRIRAGSLLSRNGHSHIASAVSRLNHSKLMATQKQKSNGESARETTKLRLRPMTVNSPVTRPMIAGARKRAARNRVDQ